MIIISVDPGNQTGFVIFDTENASLCRFTLPLVEAYEFIGNIIYDVMLIETMPLKDFGSDETLRSYYFYYIEKPNTRKISPGNWKPLAKAQEWDNKGNTPHEKDAYNMLRFWYLVTYRIDLGER